MECRLSLENKNGEHVPNDDDGCLECEDDDEYYGDCVGHDLSTAVLKY